MCVCVCICVYIYKHTNKIKCARILFFFSRKIEHVTSTILQTGGVSPVWKATPWNILLLSYIHKKIVCILYGRALRCISFTAQLRLYRFYQFVYTHKHLYNNCSRNEWRRREKVGHRAITMYDFKSECTILIVLSHVNWEFCRNKLKRELKTSNHCFFPSRQIRKIRHMKELDMEWRIILIRRSSNENRIRVNLCLPWIDADKQQKEVYNKSPWQNSFRSSNGIQLIR